MTDQSNTLTDGIMFIFCILDNKYELFFKFIFCRDCHQARPVLLTWAAHSKANVTG